MTEEPHELVTSRTGGRSARLIAVGIAVVLVAVVYVGVSGRGPAPSIAPPPVALASTPASATPSTTPSATPAATPGSTPRTVALDPAFHALPSPADAPVSDVVTVITVGDQAVYSETAEVGIGELHASYVVPLPATSGQAKIEVFQVDNSATRADSYGSWTFDVGDFHGGVGQDSVIGAFAPTVLLDVDRPPDPAPSEEAPPISRNGYHIRVTGQRQGQDEIVDISLALLDRNISLVSDQLQVAATTSRSSFAGQIASLENDRLSGRVLLPGSVRDKSVTLSLSGVSPDVPSLGRMVVGTFAVPLPPLDAYPVGTSALAKAVQPSNDGLLGLFDIVRSGYRIEATYAVTSGVREIDFVISAGPQSSSVHRNISGDDGLVGWPSAAPLPTPR